MISELTMGSQESKEFVLDHYKLDSGFVLISSIAIGAARSVTTSIPCASNCFSVCTFFKVQNA